jgi:hypothetical protein
LLECLQQRLEQRNQAGGRKINIDGKRCGEARKPGDRKGYTRPARGPTSII